jgi:thiazolinyl imide reductase
LSQVLVCGSHYGRTYLDAIALAPVVYEMAGVLARGSLRSRELAAQLEVPLYRDAGELPDGVDIACAALGTSGCAQVLALVERGIAVLCEHPQPPHFLEAALATAARRHVPFHINGHFPYLKAPAAFIQASRERCRTARPRFVDAILSDRALYATLDILRRAIGSCKAEGFASAGRTAAFTILHGRLAETPAAIQIQESTTARGAKLPDASTAYLVDCRVTLGFPTGVLTLTSMHGPVVWNSGTASITDRETALWTLVDRGKVPTPGRIAQQRAEANRHALDLLARQMRREPAPAEQAPEHILEVAAAWECLGQLLKAGS